MKDKLALISGVCVFLLGLLLFSMLSSKAGFPIYSGYKDEILTFFSMVLSYLVANRVFYWVLYGQIRNSLPKLSQIAWNLQLRVTVVITVILFPIELYAPSWLFRVVLVLIAGLALAYGLNKYHEAKIRFQEGEKATQIN